MLQKCRASCVGLTKPEHLFTTCKHAECISGTLARAFVLMLIFQTLEIAKWQNVFLSLNNHLMLSLKRKLRFCGM